MRRFRGCGPFLPPISDPGVSVKERDAIPKEDDAILKEDLNDTLKETDDDTLKNGYENDNFDRQSHANTLDELVKMLDLEEVTAADEEQLEKFKKELQEEKTRDPDYLPFYLLRLINDDLEPLEEEAAGFNLNDIKMEANHPPDVRVIVPPPGSVSSGYSSGSSVGSSSPSGHSISDIKTEQSLEDQDREQMAFSLGLIKKEIKEDHDDMQMDTHDKNIRFSLDNIKEEQEDLATGGLPADLIETKCELSAEMHADYEVYVCMEHYNAQYGPGELGSGENEPGPEIELFELAYAISELEEQMQLSEDEKMFKLARIVDAKDEDVDKVGDEHDQDDEDTDEDNYSTDEGEEFDSGVEDGSQSD